ncbi:MAG TPA: hypothetical protein VM187_09355, partial [Niastella sp.]|nr:hypothetical protein [Niastella sp.]
MLYKTFLLLCSLLLRGTLFSQTDSFEEEVQPVQANQLSAAEKIYVHTDRDFYTAGEIIWFKLYLTNPVTKGAIDISKVAYVDVLSNEGKPVLQAMIAIKNKSGSGSFLLPATFNSGTYQFRAYTNLMKNRGPDHFFQKPIWVVNILKRLNYLQAVTTTKYEANFFPEGGNLVTGLQSAVAFKTNDQYGNSIACTGVLLNNENDTIAKFKTYKFGMGRFSFTPFAGMQYRAILKLENGTTLLKEMPIALAKGYVMALSQTDSNQVRVTVTTTNIPDDAVYLVVHTAQNKNGVLKKLLQQGKTEFVLAKKSLQEGVSTVTVLDQAQQPQCERLYFNKPEKELKIQVQLPNDSYKPRSEAVLNIAERTTNSLPVSADLSVSVYLIDSLQTHTSPDIQSYLWLTSDLKGFVENPGYYFTANGKEKEDAFENLLLTQGWRRFKPKNLLEKDTTSVAFLPEYEGHVVSGTVLKKATGKAAKGIRTYLSVPGNPYHFSSTTSDELGRIHFVLHQNFGGAALIVQTSDSTCQVELEAPFSNQYDTTAWQPFHISEVYQKDLAARNMNVQTEHAFYKDQQQQFYIPETLDTTAFYGTPDKSYWLDDYTRFTTMEEILREYVTDVRARKNGNQYHFMVRNIPYQTYFDAEPLILLDGVPVLNTNQIMAFDPLKVRKVDVVARKYFLDDLVCNGIVSFTTYEKDLDGFELSPNALVVDYNGLQLQREFYSPVYQTIEQRECRLPDFRNLLYWSPDIKTNARGEATVRFYTSDIVGTYAVIVQGLNADGTPGSAVST